MKHTYYKTLLLIFFSVYLVSCKRDNNVTFLDKKGDIAKAMEDLFVGYDKPNDGELLFINQNTASSIYSPKVERFSVSGAMFVNKNSEVFHNAGKIYINGTELPFNSSKNGGTYGFFPEGNSVEGEFLKKLWGHKIKVELGANGANRVEEDSSSTYIPMAIEMQASFVNTKVISIAESLSITWQPDPNNPTGKVFLFAVYEGPESKEVNSSFSDTTEVKFQKELFDNGSHTLNPNELGSGFPVGCRISFYLARGNYQVITTSEGTDLLLQAIAYSSSSIIAVRE